MASGAWRFVDGVACRTEEVGERSGVGREFDRIVKSTWGGQGGEGRREGRWGGVGSARVLMASCSSTTSEGKESSPRTSLKVGIEAASAAILNKIDWGKWRGRERKTTSSSLSPPSLPALLES